MYNFTDLSGGIIMPVNWKSERQYQDIMYQTYKGMAKISINRPQVHNAFTPKTVMELIDAFSYARDDQILVLSS